ncbi:helix-turn-helix transcriptional regulator [Thermosipho ferrireducens]|uniref:Helix-turn-helix transcriptional regulator n=1 Tax=Thermosipho ferrireducens TaxID=2571116 RepID=A0ABX7S4J0_9BACT|nr:metalloregulator ArsR/SmtB family transcription factor [Thermosipho ferrireducens]QTA37376.1 helix-turn-helix transcriptional regulator [Thermosipho ferrireducens]
MNKIKKSKDVNIEVCQTISVHEDVVDKVRKKIPENGNLSELSEFFKIFGDPTRIKILYALSQVDELCVCDISVILKKTHSAISHQLRILRQAKLVKYRKEGKVVFYSLNDEHIKAILDMGYIHLFEEDEKTK